MKEALQKQMVLSCCAFVSVILLSNPYSLPIGKKFFKKTAFGGYVLSVRYINVSSIPPLPQ